MAGEHYSAHKKGIYIARSSRHPESFPISTHSAGCYGRQSDYGKWFDTWR